jgi:hypothetical protein
MRCGQQLFEQEQPAALQNYLKGNGPLVPDQEEVGVLMLSVC